MRVIFSSVEGLKPGVYMFSEEGKKLRSRLYVSRSQDVGRSWAEPALLNAPLSWKAGITARPFVLPDGTLCVPLEFETSAGPNGTAMIFSQDDGRTFGPPVTVAADPAGRLNLCDDRFDCLPDGRLIALFWTFRQDNEETIEVHQSFSSDGGHSWTEPEGIGFIGQITAPLVLPSGEIIAASNYRKPPEGIRLWVSPDGGGWWDTRNPIQMSDAGRG